MGDSVMDADCIATPSVADYLGAIRSLVESRPGFEPGNYLCAGNWADGRRAYDSDRAQAYRDLLDARKMLAYLERAIDVDAGAFERNNSRVTFLRDKAGRLVADYCAGQYYPTEYRAGACKLLANVLWDRFRDSLGPDCTGADIRKAARNALGRTLADRWFR